MSILHPPVVPNKVRTIDPQNPCGHWCTFGPEAGMCDDCLASAALACEPAPMRQWRRLIIAYPQWPGERIKIESKKNWPKSEFELQRGPSFLWSPIVEKEQFLALQYHPEAAEIRDMTGHEHEQLRASIRDHAFWAHNKITLAVDETDGQVKILDGRSRHSACVAEGIVPPDDAFQVFDPKKHGDIKKFVRAMGKDRRQK